MKRWRAAALPAGCTFVCAAIGLPYRSRNHGMRSLQTLRKSKTGLLSLAYVYVPVYSPAMSALGSTIFTSLSIASELIFPGSYSTCSA